MSLVGSLEDLGLADILQIVSLARKSGLLVLRSEDGEARIAFREGLVHAAVVKGQPEDLDALLLGAGVAASAASPERIEKLRRELVERAMARVFEWRSGEFSFDVCDDPECGPGLSLDVGLSPQYLAMEATRRHDEERAGIAGGGAPVVAAKAAGARAATAGGEAPVAPLACAHLVIIDPDLLALEWLKTTLADLFERLHLQQSAEGGIARIRQYLSRGEVPAVLLSARAPMDPLSGIDTAAELLRRLRVQAPRMPLLLVAEEGAPEPRAARLADAVLVRPGSATLEDPRSADRVAAAGKALRARISRFAREGS